MLHNSCISHLADCNTCMQKRTPFEFAMEIQEMLADVDLNATGNRYNGLDNGAFILNDWWQQLHTNFLAWEARQLDYSASQGVSVMPLME